MPLVPGTRVGPYEILSLIGAGGMGEVYEARDPTLNRRVAIKILPDLFTSDPDRLARFRREAQVLASLNHSNIGHIYGTHEAIQGDGRSLTHALVLELVEGPTLADRVAQGPIPLEDALPIARQIADALDCAHELGIVHRDLKPANIKVRDDGTVKVLDFGLAKALDPAAASASDAMNSPTLTARATQTGLIMGTAAYMAPEQARGRAVDRRADIWAFGAVLFEMLTGRRAFDGDDVSVMLAAVLKDDPDWRALPADLPQPIRRLLRRCLEKDPKRRLGAISDARLEIDEALSGGNDEPDPRTLRPAAMPTISIRNGWLPWAIAFTTVLALAAVLLLAAPWRVSPSREPVRLAFDTGLEGTLDTAAGTALALSPDGRHVALVVRPAAGRSQLFLRKLDQLTGLALSGTEGAASPFFSPDGQWIGFFADGKVKKVSVNGGSAQSLTDAPAGRGGAWTIDDLIIFQAGSGPNAVLKRVSALSGGPAETFGSLQVEHGSGSQRWPQALPDGKTVLYTEAATTSGWDSADIAVRPLSGGKAKAVVRRAYHGRYVRSGHILYVQDAKLIASRFDLDRLEVAGPPVAVVDGVASALNSGAAQFTVSDEGTLLYILGVTRGLERPLHWLDARGATSPLSATPAHWYDAAFSPNGKRLAMTLGRIDKSDVWIYDWELGPMTKLTSETGLDATPLWTPGGRGIVFSSNRDSGASRSLYWQRADGGGEAQRLTTRGAQIPTSFHPTEKLLMYQDKPDDRSALWDLMVLPLEGDDSKGWTAGTPWSFAKTDADEMQGVFSPDGRWVAYVSVESGLSVLYVRPFPGPGNKRTVSSPASRPTWSMKRPQLFFSTGGGTPQYKLMVADYTTGADTFTVTKVAEWSSTPLAVTGGGGWFALHPDGNRFAVALPDQDAPAAPERPVITFNFFDELRRLSRPK